MSITANPQQSHSREVALAAIKKAHEQIGSANEQPAQFDEMVLKLEQQKNSARHPSNQQPRIAMPNPRSSRRRLVLRSFMGLLALASIGVAASARLSTRDQAVQEPISNGSVSIEKREPAPQAFSGAGARADASGLSQTSSRVQTTLQGAVPEAPTAAQMAPDPAQSIQMIARELANLARGIEQLKTGQAQIVYDNAEMSANLKGTQEMARHSTELAEGLKAGQLQITRDNLNLAEQLKASQERFANFAEQLKVSREGIASIAEQFKASQEQFARLVASEQKPRPKTFSPSPQPIANTARKLAPVPQTPQARVQPADPGHLQPKQ